MQEYTGGSLDKTTYYLSNYEEIEINNTVAKKTHYLYGLNGLIAIMIEDANQSQTLYYVCTDHLGSITALVNTSGTVTEEFSYDAWGRRRNPTDWTFDNVPASQTITRGFTGHEHLGKFDLINMNSRLYDPIVGRFLSADNFSNASSTQGLNRYSYANNNPLAYTDPSGNLATGGNSWQQSYLNSQNELNQWHASLNDQWNWLYGRGMYAAQGPGIGTTYSWLTGGGSGGQQGISVLSTLSNSGMVISTNGSLNGTYVQGNSVYKNKSGQLGSYVQTSGSMVFQTMGGETVSLWASDVACTWVPLGEQAPAWKDVGWQGYSNQINGNAQTEIKANISSPNWTYASNAIGVIGDFMSESNKIGTSLKWLSITSIALKTVGYGGEAMSLFVAGKNLFNNPTSGNFARLQTTSGIVGMNFIPLWGSSAGFFASGAYNAGLFDWYYNSIDKVSNKTGMIIIPPGLYAFPIIIPKFK